jgi:hypothetical protein
VSGKASAFILKDQHCSALTPVSTFCFSQILSVVLPIVDTAAGVYAVIIFLF